MRRDAWQIGGAVAALGAGLFLSRLVEPRVHVEAISIAGETPALRFRPAAQGPHPIALLAHGVTASKETLFRFGEALAAAGFEGYALDFPGHGDSPRAFVATETTNTIENAGKALGSVDLFLGHSMGAYAAVPSVHEGGLAPKLFIAVGAFPDLGERGPPLLLLAGRFDEAVPATYLERMASERGSRLVLSDASDHALAPYDSLLIDTAVDAACAVAGKTPPARPWRWRLRLLGAALALAGVLALDVLLLDRFPTINKKARGQVFAASTILVIALSTGTWLGAFPSARHVPAQIIGILLSALVVHGAGRFDISRWTFGALGALMTVFLALVGWHFVALLAGLSTLILVAGTALAALASRGGTRRDGDITFAIFVGYAIGQWAPVMF
ncbi:alpha/beta fold hydrolase [Polyangium sp. 15x6]|uniref:alpha/beta hydrolase n=1 Tax=Polyangium sp. 15x6 TaxID=3042687 RepID=UPI002499E43D|nr:alpha/beta fold hydrolase [Polyangium sp. 15x6]MDI3287841.1 alpha/beta fold hydrolase [Polyangium sp. 15x6]